MAIFPGLDWLASAAEHPGRQRRQWSVDPDTRAWLRVGEQFEAVDLPAAAGIRVFAAMRTDHPRGATGPVAILTDDVPQPRALHLVRAGSVNPLCPLLPLQDDRGVRLDVRFRLAGEWFYTPSVVATDARHDCWLRLPTENPPLLPHADEVLRYARETSGIEGAARALHSLSRHPEAARRRGTSGFRAERVFREGA